MRLSKSALALVVALVSCIVLAILLSPLGFESRQPTDLTLVGYVAIGAVVGGVLLDLAAVVLIFFKARLASVLAMVGCAFLLFPNVADQVGAFFSAPVPPVVDILEYIFLAVLAVTLILSWAVYKESG